MADQSIVQRPRDLFEKAILDQNSDAIAKFMDEPLPAVAEAITGWLAAGPKSWTVMAGRIVQAIIKGKLFQQVSMEIKELRAKGKIADDFAEKPFGCESWVELLRVIDEETPDAERLRAIKAMFYAVNKINSIDADRIVNYQLFQIAKRLNSGELLLLKFIYGEYKSGDYPKGANENKNWNLGVWAQQIAIKIGHNLSALVERDERELVRQGLISGHINPGQHNAMVNEADARITDLGKKFCDNLESYEVDVCREIGLTK